MSEFRIFCIVFFFSSGVMAALSNRDIVQADRIGVFMMAIFLAATAVAALGKGAHPNDPR